MTFTVARAPLASALARAAAIVPERSTIPILSHVLMETSAEGLSVTATDTDVVFREGVDSTPREPWRTGVDAERLNAFVAGSAGDEVALRADDEDRVRVNCGRASCRLPTLSAEDFPMFTRPSAGAVELTIDAAAFAAALRTVAPAMAKEKTRYYLAGAFLGSGRLCATDGNRLALRTIDANLPAAPDVIIPAASVMRLLSLLRGVSGPLSVTVSRAQIIVKTSSWTLTSKVIDGTFPDYTRVLPERSPSPLLVQREALTSAAKLVASVRQDDKTLALRLTIVGTDLVVASAGTDAFGECEVAIPIEGEPPGAALRVALKPAYLLAALDAVDARVVELHIASPAEAVWVCAADEAHDGSVIMPMRA